MKKLTLFFLFTLLLTACSEKISTENFLPFPSTKQEILIASDLHWQRYESGHRTENLDEITNALINDISNSDIKTLILCGDLANSGMLAEHTFVTDLLSEIEEMGTDVFVVMGNHDVDGGVSVEDLEKMYFDLGFSEAISKDEDSMSYLSSVNDELWLLSLDFNLYDDKTSSLAATISVETLVWIEECLLLALENGAMVLPFSHHNLIEHIMPGYEIHYNIDRGDELQALLSKYGVPVYVSGHRHGSFIAYSDDESIVEFVVGTPISYPHIYASLAYNPDNGINYKDEFVDVDSWALSNGIEDETLLNFKKYADEAFLLNLHENAYSISESITDDKEEQIILAEYYIEIITNQRNRTLAENYDYLKNHEGLALWASYEDEVVFGKWIPWVLENHTLDKSEYHITFR